MSGMTVFQSTFRRDSKRSLNQISWLTRDPVVGSQNGVRKSNDKKGDYVAAALTVPGPRSAERREKNNELLHLRP